jgi:hypothetical protein
VRAIQGDGGIHKCAGCDCDGGVYHNFTENRQDDCVRCGPRCSASSRRDGCYPISAVGPWYVSGIDSLEQPKISVTLSSYQSSGNGFWGKKEMGRLYRFVGVMQSRFLPIEGHLTAFQLWQRGTLFNNDPTEKLAFEFFLGFVFTCQLLEQAVSYRSCFAAQ